LASSAVEIALVVERAVFAEGRRADRTLSVLLKERRDLAPSDHRFISESVFALLRWHGWIEPLRLRRPEERLLLAWMLDAPRVHPACRVWARKTGYDPSRVNVFGDAPGWTARAEGLKRWLNQRAVNADPWILFPGWLREHLPLPPGGGTPKLKYLELLQTLQKRPSLWVRAQGADEKKSWDELTALGLKPWVHRKLTRAARLDPEADVHHLAPFQRGELEIQDIASQAVALVCDPDPGDRWWDACAGAGGKSLHLAALMGGKGVVVATDNHSGRLKETVRRARRSPFRNVTTKSWDGKHVAGKPRSFDGVLVDAPCSAVGTWRRNPDARWTLDNAAVARLAEIQLQLLSAASAGVRRGGTLVYSVCTLTLKETQGVVKSFLEHHPDFHLDPFPHPFDASPTNGTLLIWPQEADSDAMFIARMVRTA
jgi:16S rRNA (cytosine967-C5)-methyltransferase